MKISIVILHYGDIAITKACIESLFRHETYSFSIVVVNNTKENYKSKDFTNKRVIVINNKKNLGFAGGVNVGIRYSIAKKADAIMLLNNDTVVLRPMLDALAKNLKNSETIGIAAPAIRFRREGQAVYDLGGKVNAFFGRTSHNEVSSIKNKKAEIVQYVSGCCMLIKSNVFKQIGLFDEKFFLYYEDVDFCLRAGQKNFLVNVVPSVFIEHALSKSAGQLSAVSIYCQIQSAIIFGKKYYSSGIKLVLQRIFVLYQAIIFMIKSRYGIFAFKALLSIT